MSFFKKLKDEFKDLMGDDKDDKDKKQQQQQPPAPSTDHHFQGNTSEGQRDFSHNQPAPYGGQPNQYSQHDPHGPPQAHGQPPYGQPPHGSPLPPGWSQQWDANSQRYYYLDPSGRSQWDPPAFQQQGYGAPPPQGYGVPSGYDAHRGMPQHYDQGYPQAHHASTYPTEHDKKKKSSGKGGLIAAGVGGAAIGALGAAALSGDSSDDEHHAPVHGGYYSSAPPGAAPVPLEQNPELSSSQRSSLEEAREELQEAQAEVAGDSDPSSSDIEELEEAREEYASEVESAHEELED